MTDALRKLVADRAPATDLRAAARGRTLRDDGVAKILAGQTTVAEVERVTARGTGYDEPEVR